MRRAALALAVAALAAACEDVTGPSGPRYLLLSGVWSAASSIPGAISVKIATEAAGGRLDGIGVVYTTTGVDTIRIQGQYDAGSLSFGLDIAYDNGGAAAYTGQIQSTASLSGSWTDWTTGASANVSFTRLYVPPCDDSVPLTGTYDPNAPGFLVMFQDTVNATWEADRLGALYGFTPTHVYTTAPRGFSADIPMATVTVLRCEPKVSSIEYDAVVTAQ